MKVAVVAAPASVSSAQKTECIAERSRGANREPFSRLTLRPDVVEAA